MAFVPLRPTNPVGPCPYMVRYVISFTEPSTNYSGPRAIHSGCSAICTDLRRSYRAMP